MRIETLELIGYKGIYQGTLKNHIKINFGLNRITLICGPNGSGKSTLLSAASIYPDNNTYFMDNENAEKIIILISGNNRYKINCVHQLNEKGIRKTAKAYIKKEENNSWIEYNPTGNITSYKDYIESEFDLDPNFLVLSFLSTENKGLVEKTPAERIKYINSIIQYVEVYNNINKVLTKRSAVYKSLLNSILSKIDTLGEEEKLINELDNISNRINLLKINRSNIKDIISENIAAIKLIDPDSSIQNLYQSVQISLESIDVDIRRYEKNLDYLLRENEYFADIEKYSSLEDSNAEFYNKKVEIDKAKENISNIEISLNNILIEREESLRALQLKLQRVNSLQSEYNYDTLVENIKRHTKNKEEYEKIFADVHIQNAISISKDEYILGLNTMNDIKDMINGLVSSYYTHEVEMTINLINSNANIVSIVNNIEIELKNNEESLTELSNRYSYYSGLQDKEKILLDRPSNCNIDTCPFIEESLKASKLNPTKELIKLDGIIKELNDLIREQKENLNTYKNCLNIKSSLDIIFRNINNSKSILAKLPNGNIFLDRNYLLDAICRQDSFDAITKLYGYINIANIFEEYKYTIDTLKELNNEYKLYKSKNDIIDELLEDINDLRSKLNNIEKVIESSRNQIKNLQLMIQNSNDYLEKLGTVISIQTKLEELYNKRKVEDSKIVTISSNIEIIKQKLAIIEEHKNIIVNIDNEITPLEEEKNGIQYSIAMLKQYKLEMEEYNKSYTLIETIKEYSTPTKKGIQKLFIKVYMAQTLKLANKLLGLFFGGRISLLPYQISEDNSSFSIPCFSNLTGLTTDDVSNCSRSEKTMAGLALSGALLKQASSKYNIFRIDEIEEGLDSNNRLAFINAIHDICNILGIEQFLMVSHTSELDLGNVDIIKMGNTSEIGLVEGNIICEI